jgi:uncharacterized protein with von Willebrand factor type A (vWA) domain
MKSKHFAFLLVAVLGLGGPMLLRTLADEGALDTAQPKGITVDEIIQRFAAKEKQFKEAREQYTYRQDVKVKTPDDGGEYHEVFDVTFDDQGKKSKNVVFAPQTTLERIMMTQEDIDDIENRLPFVLTSDEIGEYSILYVGQQQEDELHCYVFDIAPKQIEGKKRYFQGRIWVDDRDFQFLTSAKRKTARTCSQSSLPGASRLTRRTGFPPTRRPTILSILRRAAYTSWRL